MYAHVFGENVILVLFWNIMGQVFNFSDKNTPATSVVAYVHV